MTNLIEIADYYTRLRIAGMTDHEVEVFKESLIRTTLINVGKINTIELLADCVKHFEELQLKNSDKVESEIIKKELKSKGVLLD